MRAASDPRALVSPWLSRASMLQFASLALQAPSAELVNEMQALVASLPDADRADARRILDVPIEDWEPEYFSVLGPAGIAAAESSYERAAQASRGPLLMEVSGFYTAFGYAPERLKEVPDHAAVELGFLSFLAMKIAFATFEGRSDEASIAEQAFADFEKRHLEAWLPECASALQASGSELYAAIGVLARKALRPGGDTRTDDPST